ncbi:hypothetical protein EXU85_28820 [Spirosoma sp. KCTC 42546]|uniref:hypothetical protein n=1 Tax=Spirosoma sp. KCTC 42546 TaxID=2520506 RepID=UPI00115B8DBA|nr:hypothetical protein [Spirosoma sp. KCTC 42546]QDK82392.1 hypothetical protein EXU85_28800 [Spirosoma sp. KCTC 42546]QDK82396.1 hypothetical protein EXU85_28820 [Spirosoma sp. KCTC 42546]
MNKKNLLVVVGLMILATACKENDTVKPSYVNNTYSSESEAESPSLSKRDSVVKRVLPIKIQPIEQPATGPLLGKGKDILEQQEEIN